eukprot:jgi/Botrbrau1/11464/Bobra.27_4s0005.1
MLLKQALNLDTFCVLFVYCGERYQIQEFDMCPLSFCTCRKFRLVILDQVFLNSFPCIERNQ